MHKSVNLFKDLIAQLCSLHKDIRHSKEECHFSSNLDDAQNKHARKMHYPCVLMDFGDFVYKPVGNGQGKRRNVTLIFVDHAKDVGNASQIDAIFDHMEDICDDFMEKILSLSRSSAPSNRFLRRFSLDGVEATRIQLESPALYGWAVVLPSEDIFCHDGEEDSPWETSQEEYQE